MFNTLKTLSTWLLILSMTACAHIAENKPINARTAQHLQTDSQQVLNTLLTLIDSIKRPEDINPEHFLKVTGIELVPTKEEPKDLFFRQGVKNSWRYMYYIYHASDIFPAPIRFEFYTNDTVTSKKSSLIDICTPNIDQFRQSLTNRGYALEGFSRDMRNRFLIYTRNNIAVRIDPGGGKSYTGEGGCVMSVEIFHVKEH